MKVNELSKELNITNKDLITFLKSNGHNISSHMQTVTDEMCEAAREHFIVNSIDSKDASEDVKPVQSATRIPAFEAKTYSADDMIPCKSLVPWKLCELGLDRTTVYYWGAFGDIEYVSYRDLQYFKRSTLLKDAKILIMDENLCYQWSKELGNVFQLFLKVDYPEEFFDINDAKFEELLKQSPDVFKEVIKYTAMNMIRNENYPSLQKINIIDSILGTCIKEFL